MCWGPGWLLQPKFYDESGIWYDGSLIESSCYRWPFYHEEKVFKKEYSHIYNHFRKLAQDKFYLTREDYLSSDWKSLPTKESPYVLSEDGRSLSLKKDS